MNLAKTFFERPTLIVAQELIGKLLVHYTEDGQVGGIIVETEAYRGNDDPASHASRGLTPRNEIMFGSAGYAYVYFNYGVHNLFNVVTEKEGIPGAVLIRALEPVAGIKIMQRRRKKEKIEELCKGPACVTQALGISLNHNGHNLSRRPLLIENGYNNNLKVANGPRIGITKGTDKNWRFHVKDSPYISKYSGRKNEIKRDS
jgi:DNA-3-methyladenine glycosylase